MTNEVFAAELPAIDKAGAKNPGSTPITLFHSDPVWYKARALEAINPHVHRHITLGAPLKRGCEMGCTEA